MVAGLQILEGPLPAKAPLLKKGPEEYTAYRSVLAVVDTSDLLLNFRWIPLHQVAQGSSYVFSFAYSNHGSLVRSYERFLWVLWPRPLSVWHLIVGTRSYERSSIFCYVVS